MALTILEGSTFCICDERGDIDGQTQGLFADDTRFLSLLRLTVNGEKPLLLTSDRIEYFSAAFFMRNPLAGDLLPDELSIRRERFVGGRHRIARRQDHEQRRRTDAVDEQPRRVLAFPMRLAAVAPMSHDRNGQRA